MNASVDLHARRFRLFDLIALIVALGVGLSLGRDYCGCLLRHPHLIESSKGYPWVLGAREWALACLPSLAALTLVLWPLWLVPPRPRLRRCVLLPGLVAGHAVALAMVLAMATALAMTVREQWAYGRFPTWTGTIFTMGVGDRFTVYLVASRTAIGPAVAASWLILWLGGGWRPERTWIDRTGRLLGALWIGIELAGWVHGMLTR